MARARTPVAKAKATAADVKNPGGTRAGRRRRRGALGGPSMWLGPFGKRAFQAFKRELPWLKESHRVLVELASSYRGRLLDPEDRRGSACRPPRSCGAAWPSWARRRPTSRR
jgi:hypothetical protein